MGRKAFGPSKKKACDMRRDCKKKKQPGHEVKADEGAHHHTRSF